jgi:hypothetical protein
MNADRAMAAFWYAYAVSGAMFIAAVASAWVSTGQWWMGAWGFLPSVLGFWLFHRHYARWLRATVPDPEVPLGAR